jgi:hypothetical protein
MIKQALTAAGIIIAGFSAEAQLYRDPIQAVGGGGRSVRIPTDSQLAAMKAEKERPTNLTATMIWVTPAKVAARHKKDGKIILEITYWKKTQDGEEGGTYLVADHPDAPYLAVNEPAKCIIVPGPIRDDFGGQRLYYFFDKKEVNEQNKLQFRARHPDAPLD